MIIVDNDDGINISYSNEETKTCSLALIVLQDVPSMQAIYIGKAKIDALSHPYPCPRFAHQLPERHFPTSNDKRKIINAPAHPKAYTPKPTERG
jgi:hypothetical protein